MIPEPPETRRMEEKEEKRVLPVPPVKKRDQSKEGKVSRRVENERNDSRKGGEEGGTNRTAQQS